MIHKQNIEAKKTAIKLQIPISGVVEAIRHINDTRVFSLENTATEIETLLKLARVKIEFYNNEVFRLTGVDSKKFPGHSNPLPPPRPTSKHSEPTIFF